MYYYQMLLEDIVDQDNIAILRNLLMGVIFEKVVKEMVLIDYEKNGKQDEIDLQKRKNNKNFPEEHE